MLHPPPPPMIVGFEYIRSIWVLARLLWVHERLLWVHKTLYTPQICSFSDSPALLDKEAKEC